MFVNLQQKLRDYKKVLLVCLIALVVLVGGLLVWRAPKSSEQPQKQAAGSAVSQDLTVPEGSRLVDIAPTEEVKKEEFLRTAASDFNLPPEEPVTPQRLVAACQIEMQLTLKHRIQSNPTYRQDSEAQRNDLEAIDTYCYQTYSEDGKVPDKPTTDPEHTDSHE